MTRSRAKVAELARISGLRVEEVLTRLQEVGINVTDRNTYVPRSKASLARRTLGIPAKPSKDSVAHLAARSGLSEGEVRERLAGEGVYIKLNLKRLREDVLKRAGLALSSHTPDASTEELVDTGLNDVDTAVPATRDAEGEDPTPTNPLLESRRSQWPLIGRKADLSYVTAEEIEGIHFLLVEDFQKSRDPIEPPGVRADTLLASAAFRPHTSIGGELKYPSVAMAGAALFHALVHDHAFHNGNKRTALVCLLVFLDKNGYVLPIDQDALYDYVLLLAQHRLSLTDHEDFNQTDREVLEVARWLQRNMRRMSRQQYRLKWHHLRSILLKYDCTLDVIPGNKINIERYGKRTQVGYRDEGSEVYPKAMKKIRADLELDEAHGYDSDIFYSAEASVDEFVNKYQRTLDRLAKV